MSRIDQEVGAFLSERPRDPMLAPIASYASPDAIVVAFLSGESAEPGCRTCGGAAQERTRGRRIRRYSRRTVAFDLTPEFLSGLVGEREAARFDRLRPSALPMNPWRGAQNPVIESGEDQASLSWDPHMGDPGFYGTPNYDRHPLANTDVDWDAPGNAPEDPQPGQPGAAPYDLADPSCTGLFKATPELERDNPCLPGFGECGGAPCVDSEDCAPTQSQIDHAERGINFGEVLGIGPFSQDEKDLVIEAYAVLQQNVDLVKHACCVAFGPNSDICDCMMALVKDVKKGDDIKIRRKRDKACEGATGAFFGDGRIKLCDCVFEMLLPDYLEGNNSQRMCALLSMARFLISELAHDCGFGAHPEQGCDPVVAMLDVLSEGLGRRCGDSDVSDCIRNCQGGVWWPD